MNQKNLQSGYKLSESELGEIRAITTLLRQEELKLTLVTGNTAIVPEGQKWVATQEGVAKLLNRSLNGTIARFANAQGIYGKISLNLDSGIIMKV